MTNIIFIVLCEKNNKTRYNHFVHVVLLRNKDEILQYCRDKSFTHPLFIDLSDSVNILNEFPTERELSTFLIDKHNNVKLVGNPLFNFDLEEELIRCLNENLSIDSNVA